jgi:hypothetical protein
MCIFVSNWILWRSELYNRIKGKNGKRGRMAIIVWSSELGNDEKERKRKEMKQNLEF